MRILLACVVFLILAAILWAALPASDNFNRANANPIGGNWTTTGNAGAMRIVTNAANGTSATTSAAHWNADSFSNDQYSEIKLMVVNDDASKGGPTVRAGVNGANPAGYVWFHPGTANTMQLYKWDGSGADVYTQIGSNYTVTLSNGILVKLQIAGTTLTPYVNAVAQTTQTDSTWTSGSAGMQAYDTPQTLDDWGADNVGGARRRQAMVSMIFGLPPFSLLEPATVRAQATFRIYLMPLTGTGILPDVKRPKYAATLAGLEYGTIDAEGGTIMLVVVRDIPAATHTLLAANVDVAALPQDLDGTVGAAATATQAFLEARNLPSTCAQSTDTYRQVARCIARDFLFRQRLQGTGFARLFQSGITLDTQFNQLPIAVRNNLVSVASNLSYSTATLSGTSTLRVILKAMSDQWRGGPISIRGETL